MREPWRDEQGIVRDASPSVSGAFSLLEVVIALALVSGLLLAAALSFSQASRSSGSGRELTQASLIGSSIVEEMEGWPLAECWQRLGGADTESSLEVDGSTCAGAAAWQAAAAARLGAEARALLRIEPLGAATFGGAAGVRITVTIVWTSYERPRRISLVRLRF